MRSYSPDETYSIQDLNDWNYPGVSLAVLGHPVHHSISPQMHNAALQELAKTDAKLRDWRYFKFDIKAERLGEALPRFHANGFFGINLTVPHKEVALRYIEEIDADAKRIAAVNTLVRLESGYKGYNTDGYGLSSGINHDLAQSVQGSDVVLLGAGGAARAAAVQCIQDKCKTLTIINRNSERLERLISDLNELSKTRSIPLRGLAPDPNFEVPPNALIINATSLGLKNDDPIPLQAKLRDRDVRCFDMIYNPPRTKLMELVAKEGGLAANGLSMLIYQGAKALEIWSQKQVPVDVMSQAAHAAIIR